MLTKVNVEICEAVTVNIYAILQHACLWVAVGEDYCWVYIPEPFLKKL